MLLVQGIVSSKSHKNHVPRRGDGEGRMTIEKKDTVSLEDAKRQVDIVARRIALLHLSYAKTMVEEFGEERGRKLILKAIKDYGIRIGENMKRGGPDWPDYGGNERIEWVDAGGEKRMRVYGCVLADEWKAWEESSLGRLYCYVDPAKSITVDPTQRAVHVKAVPDGDKYCELAFRSTTEKEREDFADKEADWEHLDKP